MKKKTQINVDRFGLNTMIRDCPIGEGDEYGIRGEVRGNDLMCTEN